MNWQAIVQSIDAPTAQAFVAATRHVLSALVVEVERAAATQTPPPRDYNTAELPRESAPGGWLSPQELRATSQRLTEALAGEKWTDGFVAALKCVAAIGGVL